MKRLSYSAPIIIVTLFALVLVAEPPSARAQGLKLYYLTASSFAGDVATQACATGYHMASIAELSDLGNHRYVIFDPDAYKANGDQGHGPPTNIYGWLRTGETTSATSNCSLWKSTSSGDTGLTAAITINIGGAPSVQALVWDLESDSCTATNHVWCVEDY